jgi:hypothetical protein
MKQDPVLFKNEPFELRTGVSIIIPSGVTLYFSSPRQLIGARSLTQLACLQQVAGEKGKHARYRFVERDTRRGKKFFLPAGLKAGDEIRVIWCELKSAAAVSAQHYKIYCDQFAESRGLTRESIPEAWD